MKLPNTPPSHKIGVPNHWGRSANFLDLEEKLNENWIPLSGTLVDWSVRISRLLKTVVTSPSSVEISVDWKGTPSGLQSTDACDRQLRSTPLWFGWLIMSAIRFLVLVWSSISCSLDSSDLHSSYAFPPSRATQEFAWFLLRFQRILQAWKHLP